MGADASLPGWAGSRVEIDFTLNRPARLSLALGSFLAGLAISESRYGLQALSDALGLLCTVADKVQHVVGQNWRQCAVPTASFNRIIPQRHQRVERVGIACRATTASPMTRL